MEYFQGRLLVEIVWPLLLFLILFLVRLRGLKKNHHECKETVCWLCSVSYLVWSYLTGYFEEKAMPSAGFIPFVQNFICTFNNTCHQAVWTEPGKIQQYNKSL